MALADRPDDDAAEILRARVRAFGGDRLLVFVAEEIAASGADRRGRREIWHARGRVPLSQPGRIVAVDDRRVAQRRLGGERAAVLQRAGDALPAIAVERAADAQPGRRNAGSEEERDARLDRRWRRRRGA